MKKNNGVSGDRSMSEHLKILSVWTDLQEKIHFKGLLMQEKVLNKYFEQLCSLSQVL